MGCLFVCRGVSVTGSCLLLVVECWLLMVGWCLSLVVVGSWLSGFPLSGVGYLSSVSVVANFLYFWCPALDLWTFSYLYKRWTWEWVLCWRVGGRCLPPQSRKSRACFLQTSTLCPLFPVINCNRYTFLLFEKHVFPGSAISILLKTVMSKSWKRKCICDNLRISRDQCTKNHILAKLFRELVVIKDRQ